MSLILSRVVLSFSLLLSVGCAVQPLPDASARSLPSVLSPAASLGASHIEVAFSPEAGSEAPVVKVIASARESIRLARYSFTSPAVVKALIDAKTRGVDLRLLIDDRGNCGAASQAAPRLVKGAGIALRVISIYAIHHDKYIVPDGTITEIGSFNYSQATAKSNSENVLVFWNDRTVAAQYLAHWKSRWVNGVEVEVAQQVADNALRWRHV